jgi:ketosteroid isomerase-like protein
LLEDWVAPYDQWDIEVEELLDVGNEEVLAVLIENGRPVGSTVVAYRARGRASGVELAGRESALLTLRGGKVVRYEWFHDPADALSAASFEE